MRSPDDMTPIISPALKERAQRILEALKMSHISIVVGLVYFCALKKDRARRLGKTIAGIAFSPRHQPRFRSDRDRSQTEVRNGIKGCPPRTSSPCCNELAH